MRAIVNFSFFLGLLFASSVFALDAGDRDAIHKIVGHFTNAWNQHEGRGSADHYAEDADFVNIFGTAFSGKKEIESRHVKIHEAFLKGTLFKVTDLKIREVKPGIAMVQVYWIVSGIQKPGAQAKEAMKGIFTHAFIKNNDQWEITSTQNTMIKE
jgi:uncharacterized protein (TIGR02246 family)